MENFGVCVQQSQREENVSPSLNGKPCVAFCIQMLERSGRLAAFTFPRDATGSGSLINVWLSIIKKGKLHRSHVSADAQGTFTHLCRVFPPRVPQAQRDNPYEERRFSLWFLWVSIHVFASPVLLREKNMDLNPVWLRHSHAKLSNSSSLYDSVYCRAVGGGRLTSIHPGG